MGAGGGPSQTTTFDPEFNAGLLAIFKEQNSWARQAQNYYMYGVPYDPNEEVSGYLDKDGNFVEANPDDPDQLQSNPNYKDTPPYDKPGDTGGEGWNPGKYQSPGGPRPAVAQATNTGQTPEMTPPPSQQQGEVISGDVGFGGSNQFKLHEGNQYIPADPNRNYITKKRGDLEGYDPEGQTSEAQYLQKIVDANAGLLGLQTDVTKGQLQLQQGMDQSALRLLPTQEAAAKSGLELGMTRDKYRTGMFDTISKGIDIGKREDQAQANVQHGMKNARKAGKMDLMSYGLDPNSGRYASTNRDLQLKEATGVAGARTQARNYGEAEDFERRKVGLSI
jgi:hypothetical protein